MINVDLLNYTEQKIQNRMRCKNLTGYKEKYTGLKMADPIRQSEKT